jgi:hypothetical protein
MIDITRFAGLASGDHGLAVIALARPDGTVRASVANAGVLPHPVTGVSVVDAERLRLLLREIFTAAGGIHDDFSAYDRAMAAERRTAILVTPHISTATRDGRPPARPDPATAGAVRLRGANNV